MRFPIDSVQRPTSDVYLATLSHLIAPLESILSCNTGKTLHVPASCASLFHKKSILVTCHIKRSPKSCTIKNKLKIGASFSICIKVPMKYLFSVALSLCCNAFYAIKPIAIYSYIGQNQNIYSNQQPLSISGLCQVVWNMPARGHHLTKPF